jgi:hypothetical protein
MLPTDYTIRRQDNLLPYLVFFLVNSYFVAEKSDGVRVLLYCVLNERGQQQVFLVTTLVHSKMAPNNNSLE